VLIAFNGEGRTLMLDVEPGVFSLNGLPVFEIDENGILVGGLRFDHLGTSAMLPPSLRPSSAVVIDPINGSRPRRGRPRKAASAAPEPELPVYEQPGEDDVQS
jgi:hypothetical protein